MELEIQLLLGFICYLILILILDRRGMLSRWGFRVYGPILLLRKQLGPGFLSGISRYGIWNWIARSGLIVFGISMGFSLWILVAGVIASISRPLPSISPRELFLIPGINPWIPLVWGVIGIGVAVIAHEFWHGIQCRIERIKLRSMGLLIAFFPLGAFVEPDSVFLKLARNISKLKVLAMGAMANFILAGIFLGGFYLTLTQIRAQYETALIVANLTPGSLADQLGIRPQDAILELNSRSLSSVEDFEPNPGINSLRLASSRGIRELSFNYTPQPGLGIIWVKPGSPAWGNLSPGTRLVSLNGIEVRSYEHFHEIMANTTPGQRIQLQILDSGKLREIQIILDRNPYFEEPRGFIGVLVENIPIGIFASQLNSSGYLERIRDVLEGFPSLRSFLSMLGLPALDPYQGFRGFSGSLLWDLYHPKHLLTIADIFFWIGWVNLVVGLFNTLPGLPLDGGHFFRSLWDGLLSRLNPRWVKHSSKISYGMSVLVWGAILLGAMIRSGFHPALIQR